MRRFVPLIFIAAVIPTSGQVRLNDIQVIGSHNSYHVGLAPSAAALMAKRRPDVAAELAYKHPPLDQQLSSGVRQLEIDIYTDPEGGLFEDPKGPHQVAEAGLPADPPFDPEGLMKKPGFKVIHVKDYDYRSNCQPFVACLAVVRNWSKAHPGHLPIFVLIENKDEHLDSAVLDAMDAEIRTVFAPSEMITPDDVRGSFATLEKAVLAGQWPTLDSARGKVVFLMDQSRLASMYADGHPSLKGRVLFSNSKPGTPEGAFIEVNDPGGADIRALVRKGYLVRTRTDAELKLDPARRAAAMASGAQLLSTDFPFDEVDAASGYSVRFDGAGSIARCNPVRKNPACRQESLR